MLNPYLPRIAVIRKIISENEAKDIKTFEVVFEDEEVAESFDYKPGQFAELSYFGVGECPIGIASSPLDRGFLQFTIKKIGVVTTALHNCIEGERIGIRGPTETGGP